MRWKQWLLTTLAIWMISLVVPELLRLLFGYVPLLGTWGIRQGLNTAITAALVIYVFMPRVARWAAGWLFRGAD